VTAASCSRQQHRVVPVTLQSHSEDMTREIGRELGRLLQAGDVLCLEGELGTGKTVLAQGLAEGVGVTDPVTSPSFTLIHEHQGRLPFYHVDLYRLSPNETDSLGLEQYLSDDGAVVVEWAERLPAEACPDCLRVRLRYLVEADSREIAISACGDRAADLLCRFTQSTRERTNQGRPC